LFFHFGFDIFSFSYFRPSPRGTHCAPPLFGPSYFGFPPNFLRFSCSPKPYGPPSSLPSTGVSAESYLSDTFSYAIPGVTGVCLFSLLRTMFFCSHRCLCGSPFFFFSLWFFQEGAFLLSHLFQPGFAPRHVLVFTLPPTFFRPMTLRFLPPPLFPRQPLFTFFFYVICSYEFLCATFPPPRRTLVQAGSCFFFLIDFYSFFRASPLFYREAGLSVYDPLFCGLFVTSPLRNFSFRLIRRLPPFDPLCFPLRSVGRVVNSPFSSLPFFFLNPDRGGLHRRLSCLAGFPRLSFPWS